MRPTRNQTHAQRRAAWEKRQKREKEKRLRDAMLYYIGMMALLFAFSLAAFIVATPVTAAEKTGPGFETDQAVDPVDMIAVPRLGDATHRLQERIASETRGDMCLALAQVERPTDPKIKGFRAAFLYLPCVGVEDPVPGAKLYLRYLDGEGTSWCFTHPEIEPVQARVPAVIVRAYYAPCASEERVVNA